MKMHGDTGSHEYRAWSRMKQRCYNIRGKPYQDYGGRGISVCVRWLHSYANFLADMGRCPAGLTLERKNSDGNYTPKNCKWATHSEQANNRRKHAHCKRGHLYTKENTYWPPSRLRRQCRACKKYIDTRKRGPELNRPRYGGAYWSAFYAQVAKSLQTKKLISTSRHAVYQSVNCSKQRVI